MTIKKKMTDRIYDPGKSETASATAMKISPVPDGASLVNVLVKSHFSRPKIHDDIFR